MSCREMWQSNVFGRISETMSVLSIVYRYGSSAILVDYVASFIWGRESDLLFRISVEKHSRRFPSGVPIFLTEDTSGMVPINGFGVLAGF
jgi:hypothetical protein